MNESQLSVSPWDGDSDNLLRQTISSQTKQLKKINEIIPNNLTRQKQKKSISSHKSLLKLKQKKSHQDIITKTQMNFSRKKLFQTFYAKVKKQQQIPKQKIQPIKSNLNVRRIVTNADKYYGKKEVEKVKYYQKSNPLVLKMNRNIRVQSQKPIQKKKSHEVLAKRSIQNLQLLNRPETRQKKEVVRLRYKSTHVLDKIYSKY